MSRYLERYYKRREAGLCTRCGKEKPVPGQTRCFACAVHEADGKRMRYAQKHGDNPVGRPKKLYAALRDGMILCKGSSADCAAYLGITINTLYHRADSGKPLDDGTIILKGRAKQ